MFGRKVEDMLMGRIAQERPPLRPSAQGLGNKGHIAPLGDQTADLEAPVGIEIIHHPVVALHSGELLDDVGQMGGKIRTGARLAQIPDDLPRGDDKRGDQGPHPMADVLVLAFFRFAQVAMGCVGYLRCRICMPVFSSVQMTTRPCSKKRRALRYKVTDVVRFGLEVWIVAVEPIDTPMGFEVRLIQDAPDARTTHGPGAPLLRGRRPGRRDSSAWRGSGTWQVSGWPSTAHPDALRGEKRRGRPGRGASCRPLRPCAR